MPNFQRYPWNLSLIYMSIVLLLLTVCFHLRFLRKIALCIAQEATEKFTEFNSIWVAVNFRMFYQIKGNVENQELPFFLSLRTTKSYPPPQTSKIWPNVPWFEFLRWESSFSKLPFNSFLRSCSFLNLRNYRLLLRFLFLYSVSLEDSRLKVFKGTVEVVSCETYLVDLKGL